MIFGKQYPKETLTPNNYTLAHLTYKLGRCKNDFPTIFNSNVD